MRSYVECLDTNQRLNCMKSYNDCSLAAMERSRRRKKKEGDNNKSDSSSSNNNNKNNNNNRRPNPRPKPRPVPGIIARVPPGGSGRREPVAASVRPAGDVGSEGEILCFFQENAQAFDQRGR